MFTSSGNIAFDHHLFDQTVTWVKGHSRYDVVFMLLLLEDSDLGHEVTPRQQEKTSKEISTI